MSMSIFTGPFYATGSIVYETGTNWVVCICVTDQTAKEMAELLTKITMEVVSNDE